MDGALEEDTKLSGRKYLGYRSSMTVISQSFLPENIYCSFCSNGRTTLYLSFIQWVFWRQCSTEII